MATFRTLEEIEAWQQARELTKLVYEASGKGAFARLQEQVTRTGSVLSGLMRYLRTSAIRGAKYQQNTNGPSRR